MLPFYMLRRIPGKGLPEWPQEYQSAPIEFALMEKNIQYFITS